MKKKRPSNAFPTRGHVFAAAGAGVLAAIGVAALYPPAFSPGRIPARERLLAFELSEERKREIQDWITACRERPTDPARASCLRHRIDVEAALSRESYAGALTSLHPDVEATIARSCDPEEKPEIVDAVTRTSCYANAAYGLYEQFNTNGGFVPVPLDELKTVAAGFTASFSHMAAISILLRECREIHPDSCPSSDTIARNMVVSRSETPYAPRLAKGHDKPRSACYQTAGLWAVIPSDPHDTIVIQDIAVFDPDSGKSLPGRDLWIRSGKVEWIGQTGTRPVPSGSRVEPGRGRTAVPGLIDAHVHINGSAQPPWVLELPDAEDALGRMISAGLTTVADLGGNASVMRDLRARVRAGTLAGPDILYTGAHVAVKGGHPAAAISLVVPSPLDYFVRAQVSHEVTTRADVRAAVEANAAAGASILKVTLDHVPLEAPVLSDELLKEAVRLGRAKGMRVAAHVGTNEDARRALAAGVDFLAHQVYREPTHKDVIQKIVSREIPVIPTLGVFDAVADLAEGRVRFAEHTWKWVPRGLERAVASRPSGWAVPELDPWIAKVSSARLQRSMNAALLKGISGLLLVGSDSPSMGWPAGTAFHQELELLRQAGYSPAELLTAATRNNARALGLSDRGALRPGMRADVVLVDGDPVRDLSRLARVSAVFSAGRPVALCR